MLSVSFYTPLSLCHHFWFFVGRNKMLIKKIAFCHRPVIWNFSILKGGERDKRASTRQIRITASGQDQTAPKQFRKYLSARANKTELLQFLLNDWQDQLHITIGGEKIIFGTFRNEGYVIEVIERETEKQCVTEHGKVKHKLRVQIHKLRFKSTSYEFKSTSYEFKSTSYEFKFTSY